MPLSNTAVPKYYAEYRDQVLRGEIEVCREIEMEMWRIDKRIADPNLYYDAAKVEGFIKFANRECTLTNGDNLEVLPIFKVWAEQLLGWYYYDERSVPERQPDGKVVRVRKMVKLRLINKQYLIVARGAAKSMYAALLQAYWLTVDTETTHQIAVAPVMKQAEETLSPIRTAITRARGPYFKLLTAGSLQNTTGDRNLRQKLVPTKKGIENFMTGSLLEIRPMAVDKLQSLRCKYATIDEWLSSEIREDVMGALQESASKQVNWIVVAISSEGTVRNGPGDTIKLELMRILDPEDPYEAKDTSIFHYKLDNIDEVGDPNMWIKAQPNIGLTVPYEVYEMEVARAEAIPATRNETMAKRFGLPMEGFTWYFTHEETIPHRRNPLAFRGMPCSVGADLSQGDDFCAFSFLFPLRDGSFGLRNRSYITKLTYDKLPAALHNKYDEFLDEGTLVLMEGVVLDMEEVYKDLNRHIRAEDYLIRALGYDPYNSAEFIKLWVRDYTEWGVEKVIQGPRTESVPLGEIKILTGQRMLIFDELIMQYCMQNAMTIDDTNGNRKLVKRRNEEKVDNVASTMDAYIAWKLHKEEF